MTRFQLHRVQTIARPRSEVFQFFSEASNLEKLTPPFLRFRILTPEPIVMKEGALIDYRLKLYGWPVHWRTRIERFEPEDCFVDRQLRGPYRYWEHLHQFEDVPGGTQMRDHVQYELPLGWLGNLAQTLFVRRSLDRVFDFRIHAVKHLFGGMTTG